MAARELYHVGPALATKNAGQANVFLRCVCQTAKALPAVIMAVAAAAEIATIIQPAALASVFQAMTLIAAPMLTLTAIRL